MCFLLLLVVLGSGGDDARAVTATAAAAVSALVHECLLSVPAVLPMLALRRASFCSADPTDLWENTDFAG